MDENRFVQMLAGITDEDIELTEKAVDYIVGHIRKIEKNEEIEKTSVIAATMLMKYGRELAEGCGRNYGT